MNERQGQLMPNISRPSGPRPFKKKGTQMEKHLQDPKNLAANAREQMRRKKEMEQENKRTMRGESVEEIVAKTAEIISGGKVFGGWTDKTIKEGKHRSSTEFLKPSPAQLKSAIGKRKKAKEDTIVKRLRRMSDNADVPLVKIGPDSSRENPQYSKIRYESIIAARLEWIKNELRENHEYYNILSEDVQYIDNLTEEELVELFPLLPMAGMWLGKKLLGGAVKKGFKWLKGKAGGVAKKVGGAVMGAGKRFMAGHRRGARALGFSKGAAPATDRSSHFEPVKKYGGGGGMSTYDRTGSAAERGSPYGGGVSQASASSGGR